MSTPRLLVMAPYPAGDPRHGGQIRLAELLRAFAVAGAQLRCATWFPSNSFYMAGPVGPLDTPVPPEFLQSFEGRDFPLIEDLALGRYVAESPALMRQLEQAVAGGVDAVYIEQPWLLPVVEALRARVGSGFRFIYGSANIEHVLKASIFEQYQVRHGQAVIDAIKALEMRAAATADLVAAVTEADACVLRQWTQAPVVLAPNGVKPWSSDAATRENWRQRLGSAPFALYAASGHPPNVRGLCESFGESLAGLAPDQRIVLVGGVSEQFLQHPWFRRWEDLNRRRVQPLGVLPQADLDALRDLAHVFILPTTTGGGSHLKTAEALYTGKPVVATPHGMRGFEHLIDLPGVQVVAPGPEFGRTLSRVLNEDAAVHDTPDDRARRDALTWRHTLADLAKRICGVDGVATHHGTPT
jgi:glycosyltransferase involved in cell wall biosynthesis